MGVGLEAVLAYGYAEDYTFCIAQQLYKALDLIQSPTKVAYNLWF